MLNVHVIAQAVSRRLLTAEAGLRSRSGQCDVYGGHSVTGTDFSSSPYVSPGQYAPYPFFYVSRFIISAADSIVEWHNIAWGCLKIGCWGRYLGLTGARLQGSRGDCKIRSFMICSHNTLFARSNKKEWDRRSMWHACGRREGQTQGLVWRPEGKRPLGRPRCRWKDDIRMDHQEKKWGAWSAFTWLRIRTGGDLLWMRQWNFGFHKMRRISCLAAEL